MIPATFAYTRPSSLDEALAVLAANPGDAKVIAGGQSLLPLMKLRLARPEQLVDIGRVPGLRGVGRRPDGTHTIGALTTYHELLESPLMSIGVLRDAVPHIADVQVRNVGTVGGAIAHADPASDLPACLLVLDADIVVRSVRGERTIHATDFFQGAFETALEPDEILTEILLPAEIELDGYHVGRYHLASDELFTALIKPEAAGVASAYASMEQPASGYSIVGAAATVWASGGSISNALVALTGVADIAYRAVGVEDALRGMSLTALDLAGAASLATDGKDVNGDIHADAAYRTELARVFVRRAVQAALGRLG